MNQEQTIGAIRVVMVLGAVALIAFPFVALFRLPKPQRRGDRRNAVFIVGMSFLAGHTLGMMAMAIFLWLKVALQK